MICESPAQQRLPAIATVMKWLGYYPSLRAIAQEVLCVEIAGACFQSEPRQGRQAVAQGASRGWEGKTRAALEGRKNVS